MPERESQSRLCELLNRIRARKPVKLRFNPHLNLFGVTYTNTKGERETRYGTSRTDLEQRLECLAERVG